MSNWSASIPNLDAYRRASGRRRINAQRQKAQRQRRHKLLALLRLHLENGGSLDDKGLKSACAERLGVSRSVISRYWKYMAGRQWLTMLQIQNRGVEVDVCDWND